MLRPIFEGPKSRNSDQVQYPKVRFTQWAKSPRHVQIRDPVVSNSLFRLHLPLSLPSTFPKIPLETPLWGDNGRLQDSGKSIGG